MSAANPQEYWDNRYRQRPQVWSGRVNPVLAAEVAALPAGTALDLGCGEGGDAVWLAGRGWAVTAVDVSTEALRRTRAAAAGAGLADRVRTEQHDLTVSAPVGPFDLVSAQFLQSPLGSLAEALRRAAAAVGRGGTLLVVSHAVGPPWGHEPGAILGSPEQTLADLSLTDDWVVESAETRERTATGPDGHTGALVDAVVRARRRLAPQS